jgi:general secretion pathway protein L
MRTLIVQFPPGSSSPALVYPYALVQAELSTKPLPMQWASASSLPAADRQTETVALLPAAALSWHRVDLPPGLQKQPARLQAALHGLLEDRLLEDPTQLHMALQPGWKETPTPWVVVCQRAWLSAHLQALEQAGKTVHRIVPEIAPPPTHHQITALGDSDTGWLWMAHPDQGVWGHPLQALRGSDKSLGLSAEERQNAVIQAEPSVVALTSELLGEKVRLISSGQHWLTAIASGWDLAQFECRANARTRQIKNWQRRANSFWHNRSWRPARWGVCLLLASQLLGLNAWAWKTRADWQTQEQSWSLILRATFPKTQLVVDAPLQMAQEVQRLRQASGQLAASDLESMLATLGQALPAGLAAPRQWRYEPGQLLLQDFQPTGTEQQALQKTLAAHGHRWRAEGNAWLMTLAPPPPTKAVEP